MKTDRLVEMLATGAESVERGAAPRRFVVAIALGALGATILMTLLLGVRPDLRAAMHLPMFSVKVAFAAVLALASLLGVYQLSRPGVDSGWIPGTLAIPILAMWTLAVVVLARAGPSQRVALLLGQTWDECPFLIALLSLPVFVALFRAMKGLAPTRLTFAGAAAGFASGALGAFVYSWHCPELEAPFIAVWYVLGILIPTAAGALLGPRLLRW